jgi:tRNA (cmo5U34)-methyltransferase
MTDEAISLFDAHAAGYEALRRQLVPPFDAFYATAVTALALAECPLARVLDLGAGTGVLARAIRTAHPDCELTLLDGSAEMLRRARQSLAAPTSFVVGDLREALPAGNWDAVTSALAIHHLDDAAKRSLFERVHEALAPGGVFVNAEQVSGSTPWLEHVYKDWHARRAHELGVGDADWAEACERMRADHLASVEDQLAWLAAAGFGEVDCLFKDHCFAVLFARKATTAG